MPCRNGSRRKFDVPDVVYIAGPRIISQFLGPMHPISRFAKIAGSLLDFWEDTTAYCTSPPPEVPTITSADLLSGEAIYKVRMWIMAKTWNTFCECIPDDKPPPPPPPEISPGGWSKTDFDGLTSAALAAGCKVNVYRAFTNVSTREYTACPPEYGTGTCIYETFNNQPGVWTQGLGPDNTETVDTTTPGGNSGTITTTSLKEYLGQINELSTPEDIDGYWASATAQNGSGETGWNPQNMTLIPAYWGLYDLEVVGCPPPNEQEEPPPPEWPPDAEEPEEPECPSNCKGEKGDKGDPGEPGPEGPPGPPGEGEGGEEMDWAEISFPAVVCTESTDGSPNTMQVVDVPVQVPSNAKGSAVALYTEISIALKKLLEWQCKFEPDFSVGVPISGFTDSVHPCCTLYFNNRKTARGTVGRYLQIPNPDLDAIREWASVDNMYSPGPYFAYVQYFTSRGPKIAVFAQSEEEAQSQLEAMMTLTTLTLGDVWRFGEPRFVGNTENHELHLKYITYFENNQELKQGRQTGQVIWRAHTAQ